jgi:hypothetical protein
VLAAKGGQSVCAGAACLGPALVEIIVALASGNRQAEMTEVTD